MAVRVKDDKSGYNEIMKIITELKKTNLEIGIFGEGDSQIMMIAYVNEFGISIDVTDKMRGYLGATGLHLKAGTTKINIPERSYIRGYFDSSINKIDKFVRRQLRSLMSGDIRLEQFWLVLGEYMTGQMRVYMTRLKQPANHPFTIANKRGSNPLIDTGNLRQKITWRTRKVV